MNRKGEKMAVKLWRSPCLGSALIAGILVALACSSLAAPAKAQQLPAQLEEVEEFWISGLQGRVFLDRFPYDEPVFVVLSAETGGTIATAATQAGGEFEFPTIMVNPYDVAYFVSVEIPEEDYIQTPVRLDTRDFFFSDRGEIVRLRYSGLLNLYLTSPDADPTGEPGTVDARILVEVPEEAREEYESALAELAEGRVDAGIQHLEAAVEVAPDYYDALNRLGVEYMRAGRYGDAENSMRTARDLNPNDPRPLINLGTLYYQQGQLLDAGGQAEEGNMAYAAAIQVLAEAIDLDPDVAESNYYLGTVLALTDDPVRSELLLLRALELDRELHDARLTLLRLYLANQHYEPALEQTVAYLEANPNSPQQRTLEDLRTQLEEALTAQ